MTSLLLPGASVAYANWGRWVANCAFCDSAIELARHAEGFVCADCRRAVAVVWPSYEMCLSVVRLLLMRPNPKNQNWLPGETLTDLLEDNALHGILAMHTDDQQGMIMSVTHDAIAVDMLPHLNPRRELTR